MTVSFSGLILIIGVIGNGVVAAVITALRRRGHKNSVQLFLLHLAISDLMVCLLCIPLTIFTNFHYPQKYLKDREGLCKLSRFMQVRKDGGFTVTYMLPSHLIIRIRSCCLVQFPNFQVMNWRGQGVGVGKDVDTKGDLDYEHSPIFPQV